MKSLLPVTWIRSFSQSAIHCRSRKNSSPRPSISAAAQNAQNPQLRRGLENASLSARRQDKRAQRNYQLFQSLVLARFDSLLKDLSRWNPHIPDQPDHQALGVHNRQQLDREASLFRKAITHAFQEASAKGKTSRKNNPLFWNLRNSFVRHDARGLVRELRYAFQSHILRQRLPKAVTEMHLELADLRYPYEWYPATRMLQRTVHLHVGPTNSGKTYNALKALEGAKSGIYAGPLRLLAHEIYSRFQAMGKSCALITGEEQRIPDDKDVYFQSCTVEMAPLNKKVDVAIIDEIQMIGDDERGWAWTQAFLGLQAKELHLCGEERAVELIQDLCTRIGDKCIVHKYERLNPLLTMKEGLDSDFKNLQKGDCVISFTRVNLHKLKAEIEAQTSRRCAIVYGSLPPETRAHQAALFNDPTNDYDFLVASDAVGMGLNLEIKRIVFETGWKFDGKTHRELNVSEIKQIGGRAGRYRSASRAIAASATPPIATSPSSNPPVSPPPSAALNATFPPASTRFGTPGYVTTLDDEDLPLIQKAFKSDIKPIQTAGIKPPNFVVERFASYFPAKVSFSFILSRLREMCRLSDRFHLCNFEESIEIADTIEEYPLSLYDRTLFLNCPSYLSDPRNVLMLKAMAECLASMKNGNLVDIPQMDLEILQVSREVMNVTPHEYLMRLESLHKSLTLYLWLSYRCEGVFQSQPLAFHVKQLVEDKIAEHLAHLNHGEGELTKRRARMRELARRRHETKDVLLGKDDDELEQAEEDPREQRDEGDREPVFHKDDGEQDVRIGGVSAA